MLPFPVPLLFGESVDLNRSGSRHRHIKMLTYKLNWSQLVKFMQTASSIDRAVANNRYTEALVLFSCL